LSRKRKAKQKDESIEDVAIRTPIAIMVGMIAIGAILDAMLKTNNIFIVIFTGIGGVGLIIRYYRVVWKRATEKADDF
jgi:F0F1-type ATP synthase assembly protein I